MVVEQGVHPFATLPRRDPDLRRGRDPKIAKDRAEPGLPRRLVSTVRVHQGGPNRSDTRSSREELERLMKTMQRMLDFYRPGAVKVERVDILDLLKHVLSLTSQQLGQRHIEVKTNLPKSLPAIYAVNSQIQQIFFNIILNAMDAMTGGGSLNIQAYAVENGIEMLFEDSGPGIPEEMRNNIFEPFYSTKDGGTGLGLTVSYNIVTAHGGTLDLIDGRDTGACFRLFLPMGDKHGR